MTTQFYAPPSSIHGSRVVLSGDEARHIARALRKEPGDVILVVNGIGHRHHVELGHVRPEQVVGTIVDTVDRAGEPPYHLTVALGVLKNRNRFETFLEKATELGVHRIIPLLTDRTEAESLREKRATNILAAAMKQSGRSVLPDLSSPTPIADVLASRMASEAAGRWICHESANSDPLLDRATEVAMATGVATATEDTKSARPELLVLVGPEGGFSEDEVQAAEDAGCQAVLLGSRRLRAETAGIAACAAISFAFSSSESDHPDR